jgi:hypothetical protein
MSGLKPIVAILLILLAGCFAYIYKQKSQGEVFVDELKNVNIQKAAILKSLNELKINYDSAIVQKKDLSDQLVIEREKVVNLIAELQQTKATSDSLISKFQKRYDELKSILNQKIIDNNRLKEQNLLLAVQRDSTLKVAEEQKRMNDTLALKKKDLTLLVKRGTTLLIHNLKVTSLKKNTSDEKVETNKAAKTAFLKISFSVYPNEIAKSGERRFLVQITDPMDNILGERKSEHFGVTSLTYSFPVNFVYVNKSVDVEGYLNGGGAKFEKGNYNVNVYDGNELVGNTNFVLK